MTATTTAAAPRHYTPACPAPAAVRCPTVGCHRKRKSSGRRGLMARCEHCMAAGPPPVPRAGGGAPASGEAYTLTADVPADVWSVAACLERSKVPPEFREVPSGTRVVAVGRLSKSDGGGDPVVELKCGGRFVCPPHAMKLMADATPARTR